MADDKHKRETAIMVFRPTLAEREEMKQIAADTVRAMEKLFEAAPEVAEYVRQNYRPA